MRNKFSLTMAFFFLNFLIFSPPALPQAPETLLPLKLLIEIINEASGDLALQNEIVLTAVNRNRPPEEYMGVYFENEFVLRKLRQYGIEKSEVIDLPGHSSTAWDAEMAELWMVRPMLRKIADLKEVPAVLCSGSISTDTTAELLYVGPGNLEKFYQGKDVQGKIVLVNGTPETARRMAVEKFGAAGLIGYASSHPEHDPDQVGWNSLRTSEKEKPTFAFMVSTRQGQTLRDLLERGQKIEVRAVARTQNVASKDQMVAALLPGQDYPEEELVFTAHLFEGTAMQGANDNASGCVSILETARVIKNLVDQGKIPPLRRSVRFLFVPEISGTAAYIQKYPEIAKRFFANINQDMVGEALIKNRAFFNLERPVDSLPSYLGDVLQSFVEWVGAVENEGDESEEDRPSAIPPIVSPTGTRDPFYYAVTRFSGGSDHVVFQDGAVRVPSVMFIVWPDMWYHTSGDKPDKSDSTQLKRAVVMGAAAAIFLASAGPEEVQKMIAETSGRALSRLGAEKTRAEKVIMRAEVSGIQEALKDALNFINQAVDREKQALASIRFFIKGDGGLGNRLSMKIKGLDELRLSLLKDVEEAYKFRCLRENLKPQKPALAEEEMRLSKLVPVRTEKMSRYFNAWEFYEKAREIKGLPPYRIGRIDFEVRNFIDGKRSVLDIRNAVSAEYEPVPLRSIENYLLVLEKTGFIKLEKR